jgi:hypothetical protein
MAPGILLVRLHLAATWNLHTTQPITYWQDATVPVLCFLLFLCFRKATQEIFSKLDETSSRSLIFPKSFPKTKREPEGGQGLLTPVWRGQGLGHATYVHNTTNNFAPNLRWGCQSQRFAVNKGLSVLSGNRIIVCKRVNSASESKMV